MKYVLGITVIILSIICTSCNIGLSPNPLGTGVDYKTDYNYKVYSDADIEVKKDKNGSSLTVDDTTIVYTKDQEAGQQIKEIFRDRFDMYKAYFNSGKEKQELKPVAPFISTMKGSAATTTD